MVRPWVVAISCNLSTSLNLRNSFCLIDLILTSMMYTVYLNMESFLSSVPSTSISGRRSSLFIFFRNSTECVFLSWQSVASLSTLRCSAFMSSLNTF